jgi:hypothetical protein
VVVDDDLDHLSVDLLDVDLANPNNRMVVKRSEDHLNVDVLANLNKVAVNEESHENPENPENPRNRVVVNVDADLRNPRNKAVVNVDAGSHRRNLAKAESKLVIFIN